MLLLLPSAAFAQGTQHDWGRIQSIKIGSKVAVGTKTGQKVEGKVISVTADSISVSAANTSGRPTELRREEIAEIRKKSRTRTAAFAALLGGGGFFVGAAVGFGIGEVTNAEGPLPDIAGAAAGAVGGAVAGAAIGNLGTLIYKAP